LRAVRYTNNENSGSDLSDIPLSLLPTLVIVGIMVFFVSGTGPPRSLMTGAGVWCERGFAVGDDTMVEGEPGPDGSSTIDVVLVELVTGQTTPLGTADWLLGVLST
jgi:hypothetical protein